MYKIKHFIFFLIICLLIAGSQLGCNGTSVAGDSSKFPYAKAKELMSKQRPRLFIGYHTHGNGTVTVFTRDNDSEDGYPVDHHFVLIDTETGKKWLWVSGNRGKHLIE